MVSAGAHSRQAPAGPRFSTPSFLYVRSVRGYTPPLSPPTRLRGRPSGILPLPRPPTRTPPPRPYPNHRAGSSASARRPSGPGIRRPSARYADWVRCYLLFHDKRHPRQLCGPGIRTFLTDLAVHRRVSASIQTQALNALSLLSTPLTGSRKGGRPSYWGRFFPQSLVIGGTSTEE
jgi:hypothetical protein